MQKIKSWFTLVEMLIVVVIIGILSAALLPRLTGSIKETRDLKRQTDLRNIAAAVEMYKNKSWKLPFMEDFWGTDTWSFFRRIDDLKPLLQDIISAFPSEGNKNAVFDICPTLHQRFCDRVKGSYVYILRLERPSDRPIIEGGPYALLLAKVESEGMANYVFLPVGEGSQSTPWGRRLSYYSIGKQTYPARWGAQFPLCSKVEKGTSIQRIQQADGTYVCTYTNSDQLYYVIRING